MVKIEHKQTRVIVTYTGSVTEEGIIDLVNTIDRLRTDYFYRQVDLWIASPGGDVVALEYFIEAILHWKQQDLMVTTRALTSCASAAAIMLSLGDHREASSSSVLIYHYSRTSGQHGPMTSEDVEEMGLKLKNVDKNMLKRLVDRVVESDDFDDSIQTNIFSDMDQAALKDIRMEWSRRTGEELNDEADGMWLNAWLDSTREMTDQDALRARWSMLYDALLDQDQPITAALAIKLGLVDKLVEPIASEVDESISGSGSRWIRIPEWKTAYPNGMVDARYLKRHTLILGETGSGKTKSAILPVLAAAYRSPYIGVGLIIDPKREFESLLNKWDKSRSEDEGKDLVWITPDEILIDLMSNHKWSIKDMRVFRRICG